jgi:endonuclease YncB( thermonuclease family)
VRRTKTSVVVSIIVAVLCAVAWIIWRQNDQKIPLPQTIPVACSGESFAGEVVSVTDGDTVDVMREGVAVRIRLHNIDTPEKGQAFGRPAKTFTSDLAFHKAVTVCAVDRDRYGRLVADVTLPDGRSLNRELVAAGLAWWYRRYSTDQSLGALEQDARDARRGLWADDNPTPPWDWRKEKRRR